MTGLHSATQITKGVEEVGCNRARLKGDSEKGILQFQSINICRK